MSALHDAAPLLKSCVHLADKNGLLEAYKKEILEALQMNIIHPLCEEVEKDLRLHIHATVLGKNKHKLSEVGDLKDMSIFFRIRPLRFFGDLIEIKSICFI